MAKRKSSPKASENSSSKVLYTIIFASTLLIIAAIFISMQQDNLTSWATIKSQELHTFMADCKANGGDPDVRPTPKPTSPPQITFVCSYPDREVEYALAPGK